MRLATSENLGMQKYLENAFRVQYFGAIEARSSKRTAILSNKIKRSDLL